METKQTYTQNQKERFEISWNIMGTCKIRHSADISKVKGSVRGSGWLIWCACVNGWRQCLGAMLNRQPFPPVTNEMKFEENSLQSSSWKMKLKIFNQFNDYWFSVIWNFWRELKYNVTLWLIVLYVWILED